MKARVISVHKGVYELSSDGKEYEASLVGKLLYNEEYPVVGDYVEANIIGEDALIVGIYERKSFLARPDNGGHADGYVKNIKSQAMIANADYVFILTSLNDDFSVSRIARYAALVTSGNCKPVAVLTKADVCNETENLISQVNEISGKIDVAAISSLTGQGLDALKKYLKPGITVALMGSSGVGKSTLLNTLAGREIMSTKDIRESDSKGRHTTTHRQLIEIDGVSFIDTPGMREIAMCDVSEGVAETFEDISDLICSCRFSDCSHTNEKGCAVRSALKDGSLSEKRWKLYLQLQNESNRNLGKKSDKMIQIAKAKRELKKYKH